VKKNNLIEYALAIFVFLVAFGVYFKTVCPTVYIGDSGELTAAAYTLGISHPTGYPLFCLLGKLFTIIIPFGEIAFRVNLASSFAAAVAVLFVYFSMRILQKSKLIAICASFIFAFSSTLWSQAVIAEVYALNAMFFAIVIFILLKWDKEKDVKLLYWLSFVCGAGLTHHRSFLFLFPAIIWIIVIASPKDILKLKSRNLLFAFFLFLLGLSFYLYIPIRMLAKPEINWRNVSDLSGIIYHLTGAQYKTRMFVFGLKDLFFNFILYAKLLSQQFAPGFFIFVLLGIFASFRRSKKIFIFLLLVFAFNVLIALNYNIPDIEVYYIPSYMIAVVWIGYALSFLLSKIISLKINKYIVYLFIAFSFLAPLSNNYSTSDRSNCFVGYDLGLNMLKQLKKNSVFIPAGDPFVFIPIYFRTVLKIRPDVSIFDENGNLVLLVPSLVKEQNLFALADNPSMSKELRRQLILYSDKDLYSVGDNSDENLLGTIFEPQGLIFKITKKTKSTLAPKDYWYDYNIRGIDNIDLLKEKEIRMVFASYYFARFKYFQAIKDKKNAKKMCEQLDAMSFDVGFIQSTLAGFFAGEGLTKEALEKHTKACSLDPFNSYVHFNFGVWYSNNGKYKEAIKEYDKAIRFKPDFISAFVNRGISYAGIGENNKAIYDYKTALSFDPNNIGALNNLGIAYSFKGLDDDALKQYQKALEINNANYFSRYNTALIYLQRGKMKEAIAELKKAIFYVPNEEKTFNALGTAYLSKGDKKEAEKNFKKALLIAPKSAGAHYNLGFLYEKWGKLHFAEKEYKKTIKLNPKFTEPYKSLGFMYLSNKKDKPKSAYYLKKYLELDPFNDKVEWIRDILLSLNVKTSPEAYAALQKFEIKHKELPMVKKLQEAILKYPYNAYAYKALGDIYMGNKENQDAESAYKMAIIIKPDYSEANCKLGFLYQQQGRYNLAVLYYKRALRDKPNNVFALANLGAILGEQGKHDEALKWFENVLTINSLHFESLKNIGVAYYGKGEYHKAVESFEKAINCGPYEIDVHVKLGAALFELKQYERAVREFEDVLKKIPKNTDIRAQFALVLYIKGDYPKALKEVRAVIKQKPWDEVARQIEKDVLLKLSQPNKTNQIKNKGK